MLKYERISDNMKFVCNKNEICEAIVNVSKAVAVKSTIPALEGIKIKLTGNILELTGYDLELGIKTRLSVKTEEEGECVINARLFNEIIKKMPADEICIYINEKMNVTIECGLTEYNISAMEANEYPELPEIDNEKSIVIPQSILKNMIEQTIYAVSVSDNKPILTGELFDIDEEGNFNMAALDGFRLAVRNEKINCNEKYNFVVPSKALSEVSRLLIDDDSENCELFTNGRHIIFDISGYLVFSRLLEGEFHNYRNSIPNDFTTEVIIKTKELTEALERCSLLISEKNKSPIKCVFSDGQLNLSCQTAVGKISDELTVDINGNDVTIGFNNRFAIEALKAASTEKVRLQMNGGNRPIKILPMVGNSFTYLLMPVTLRN